ncbi:unnamed protein product [Schistocephalus solidus]|uniref:Glutamate receptor ionotropic, delta-2 n=1 Tax=Schistocephalus solidus TaxID=70667 RepID=A0A183SGD1_SCHSO|nr:unnamed protein product [Schistocephalus solidus]
MQHNSQSTTSACAGLVRLMGQLKCCVSFRGTTINAICYVTKSSLNHLGVDWIEQLGLADMLLSVVCSQEQIPAMPEDPTKDFSQRKVVWVAAHRPFSPAGHSIAVALASAWRGSSRFRSAPGHPYPGSCLAISAAVSAEAAEMEVIQLPGFVPVDSPGLRSVKECRQEDGLVHLQFGVQVNTMVTPHGGLQPAKGLTGFEDPLSNLVVDSRVA